MENTWLVSIEKECPNLPKVIIANKADLPKLVEPKEIKEFELKHKLKVFESSAKDGKGINQPFDIIIEEIMKMKKNIKKTEEETTKPSFPIDQPNQNNTKEKKGCC